MWTDPRLAFASYNESISIPYNMIAKLWVPDLYFKNEKMARMHTVTVPNQIIALFPGGRVIFSQRLMGA